MRRRRQHHANTRRVAECSVDAVDAVVVVMAAVLFDVYNQRVLFLVSPRFEIARTGQVGLLRAAPDIHQLIGYVTG